MVLKERIAWVRKNKSKKQFYGNGEIVNRTINMQFRVMENELRQVEKRQAEVGILYISSYLRKMALNGICINLNSEYLREASHLLWSISNNMNEYAKK